MTQPRTDEQLRVKCH